LRNIVSGNGKGIKVPPNSFAGYVTAFNIVPDGFQANTPRGDSDFIAAPSFLNPAGPDGILGGNGFLDDDFHLLQTVSTSSPGVDVDFGDVDALADGSTRSDGLPDLGPSDAGYHYPFLPRTPLPSAVRNVVYVRSTGNDGNTGTAPDAAVGSIGKALATIATDGLVVIGPGNYNEGGLRFGGLDAANVFPALLGDTTGVLTGDAPGAVTVDSTGRAAPIVAGPVLIDGLTFTGARGPGLRILRGAHDVTIRNSIFCGNGGSGLITRGDGVTLLNDLVAANGGVGVSVLLPRGRHATRLLNDTAAANERQGITVHGLSSKDSPLMAYNNIVSGNGGTGLTWRALRGGRPAAGHNLNTDGYGAGTAPGAGDLTVAPEFTGGTTALTAGCPDPTAFAVAPTSPVIDAGVGTAVEMGLGIRSVTTAGLPDTGPIDLGFHYPPTE